MPTLPPVLLVYSHLRWGFVYQRPQHLLSRLAGRWRVLFVEEPVRCDGAPRLEVQQHGEHLTVLVPHTPLSVPGYHDEQMPVIEQLVGAFLAARRLTVDVAWLYTPMALPLVKPLEPTCVVYDCMDELSAFKDAPAPLRRREAALMGQAALVLTGGPSLYEAKRDHHPHVYCLPSAVDAEHYAEAGLDPDSPHAAAALALQGGIAHPRLGFFGVVDERLDLDLVATIADAHPDWQVVMVGPVVKIDPAGLPRRDNIHWLGMQPYDRLPHLMAGWDLCLMPFALNDSTRFISPTKTLEYMAGDKPVVSTPVRDVISLFGHAVRVAPAGPDFVRACEAMLAETPAERSRREMEMLTTVSMYSWDRSADSVHTLMSAALARTRATATQQPPAQRAASASAGGSTRGERVAAAGAAARA